MLVNRAERHCFLTTTLVILFFFPLLLGGKRKGEKNNQSSGQKQCLSARSSQLNKVFINTDRAEVKINRTSITQTPGLILKTCPKPRV